MSHFHAVRFYESTESICGTVAAFLGGGFIKQDPALVIAAPGHRKAIAAALRAVNFSVDALEESGALVMIDAATMLDSFLVNETPDPVRFQSVVGAAVSDLGARDTSSVRVYDEMVDLLWKQDRPDAAIRLETLWDRLTVACHCSLLCGHAVGHVCSGTGGRQSLCAQHSHILAGDGMPHPLKIQ